MKNVKKIAPWVIRILISFVFFLSAIAKLFPDPSYALTYFEVHQLEPMGIPLSIAQYLSRILIGVEFAIGFLLLLPFFLKRVILPVTIFMLTVFIVELGLEIIFKGNAGNCGCFGTLIEMTPLEAMLKNIVSIALLVWYYFLTKYKRKLVNLYVAFCCYIGIILTVIVMEIRYLLTFSLIPMENYRKIVNELKKQFDKISDVEIKNNELPRRKAAGN